MKQIDLTTGSVTGTMLRFALPMILGNLLQQLYNIADSLIVGQFVGPNALAAVASAYTLTSFLTSILLGLCLGSGAVLAVRYGERNMDGLRSGIVASFALIAGLAIVINVAAFLLLEPFMRLMSVPPDVYDLMREYVLIVFAGIFSVFLYNYFAAVLRAVGNSITPLIFLLTSAVVNVGMDLLLILCFDMGVAGAAWATAASQWVAGLGVLLYTVIRQPQLRPKRRHLRLRLKTIREITQFSFLTCLQQSVMYFGILLMQGRINSFGSVVMAAFAAAVKIDTFAYMPAIDFGNAFSTFMAQNCGARNTERVRQGIRSASRLVICFCLCVSVLVVVFAGPLMHLFIKPEETEILAEGIRYLRIEGFFYVGIGLLQLMYGMYRGARRPGMAVVLAFLSLGTRVLLAYVLSAIPTIGATGIWWSVPLGWIVADTVGLLYYRYLSKHGKILKLAEPQTA